MATVTSQFVVISVGLALPHICAGPLVTVEVTSGVPATFILIVVSTSNDAQPPPAVRPMDVKVIVPAPAVVNGLVVNVAFVTGPTPEIVAAPEGVTGDAV